MNTTKLFVLENTYKLRTSAHSRISYNNSISACSHLPISSLKIRILRKYSHSLFLSSQLFSKYYHSTFSIYSALIINSSAQQQQSDNHSITITNQTKYAITDMVHYNDSIFTPFLESSSSLRPQSSLVSPPKHLSPIIGISLYPITSPFFGYFLGSREK